MAAPRPNLARRPFVDSRPANLAAAILLVASVVLSVVSVRTVGDYLAGSRDSRERIASLRSEIERFEAERHEAEGKLARFDLAGLRAGAEEANKLARLRAFSWARFLTRLEKTLPNDVRVVSMRLGGEREEGDERLGPGSGSFGLSLALVTRDPDALPRLIRTFYASPWFEEPVPVSEAGGERGSAEGRRISLRVVYHDREAKP
mgnify:CR=1 FL=1